MPKDWHISPPHPDRQSLAMALRVSPVVAQVLLNRGVSGVEPARRFLQPMASDMHAPEMLPGVTMAAERIATAVGRGEKIVLFGDYDVDGITGVAILWHCLKLAGADPSFFIPHRLEEGYGIKCDAIEGLAAEGARRIISVDCGITAVEPAQTARRRGVDLIITDHHAAHVGDDGRPILPEALIVHPSVGVSAAPYPNPHLCGAGVALKLAWGIAQKISGAARVTQAFRDFLVDAMGLAALGTIADVVPLVGENRIIALHGLAGLARSRLPGVQALIETSGLRGKKLEGCDIGFKLAPRLNAIGRMGHARLAVEMLTRADSAEAMRIAQNLEKQNRARQALERRISAAAQEMVVEQGQDRDGVRAIVLASEGWHAGVIGIVAARMTEMFGRPTVMIALENGVGQGSARSIRNFALSEVFHDCREHLLTYGGHAMAAGLKIKTECVGSFRAAFQDRAAQLLTPADLRPRLDVDDVIGLSDLNEQLVSDLGRLEPFGAGNPKARFATDWLTVVGEPRVVGAGGTHLQVQLSDGRSACKAVAFGQAKIKDALLDARRCRAAFVPMINEWNGRRSVEMQVVDFMLSA